jgi:hypothetical protein
MAPGGGVAVTDVVAAGSAQGFSERPSIQSRPL